MVGWFRRRGEPPDRPKVIMARDLAVSSSGEGHRLRVVIDAADLRGAQGGRQLLGRAPVVPLLGECHWAVMSAHVDAPVLALAISARTPVAARFAILFRAAPIRGHLTDLAGGTAVDIAVREARGHALVIATISARQAPELAGLG